MTDILLCDLKKKTTAFLFPGRKKKYPSTKSSYWNKKFKEIKQKHSNVPWNFFKKQANAPNKKKKKSNSAKLPEIPNVLVIKV